MYSLPTKSKVYSFLAVFEIRKTVDISYLSCLLHVMLRIILGRLAPKIQVMSIIQKHIGYIDGGPNMLIFLFETYVTCHFGNFVPKQK